jgi:TP901 family phage tail tape measure protein
MADVNANIGVNIDTSQALAQLKSLQRQISQFHASIARSSESAALAQKSLQKNLINSINSIGAFSAELRTVRTSAETFTNSLEKNKFGMREYFRYAGASTKTFGRLFKTEFDTIGKVAEERVKTLQTQYIKLGRNASGAMEAIAVRPTALNMQDYGVKTAIAAQKQALFNQLMKQGTTNLLNFGKNTQWAGRQLMVGFTIPLSIVASTAAKTFMEMEAQTIKFRKVYGDLFTPQSETQAALENITELGKQFTKYGVAVSTTVGLAAEAAAAGFQGLDLQRQTTEATRLSILGQIDSQKALETTISLQNAFGMSSDKLADSINFLNAVENQTVVSLDDITTAIPKVAPVVQQLGGDVKDLTFFIAAMKEGGINASEGANALKSGLGALINPTNKASDMLKSFGINATAIIEKNKGNLKATVIEFANALNRLDPLSRARAIEQMFGKFQFARLSTLFANVAKDGNQASRVLDLANASVEELSALSEQELGMTADSSMNKFRKSVEDLKLALVPVGKSFLEAATPIVEFVGKVLERFGNLSDGTKKLITLLTVGIGAVGPIFLMTFGLLANGLANTLKGALILRQGFLRLTGQSKVLGEQTKYLNSEQLEAAAAAHSLDQTHAKLTQTFNVEREALRRLIAAYQSANIAARNFAFNNPGMMMPPRGGRKLASGIVSVPGPKGAGDIVPAMLSPGEAVIPAKFVEKYAPLIQGIIADNIPGFEIGKNASNSMGMVFSHGAAGRNLDKQEIQQLASAVSSSISRSLAQATRVKAFTNFGFIAPEKLNKGQMSGTESGQFFQQNAELATSRIYKSITSLLPSAASDPAVKQDVILFGKNIGQQLSLAGSKAVSEPEFYNAVENALQKTMTQATTQAFRQSIPKIQKQITTIGAFGGEINRGERGQRIGLSRKSQMLAFGYEQGMTSYKSQTLLSQLQKQGFNQGQQLSMSTVTGVKQGAAAASPSKKTILIGQDIARGLEQGMNSRQRNVAQSGSNLSTAAIKAAQSQAQLYGTTTVDAIQKSYRRQQEKLVKAAPKIIPPEPPAPKISGRFANIRGMGGRGLAGIGGATMAASMLPGKAGEIGMKVGGLAFVAQSLMMLPGPLKLVAVAFGGLYGITKLLAAAKEKERLKTEGLADAMTITSEKAKTLGNLFGETPTPRAGSGATVSSVQLTAQQKNRVEEIRKGEEFLTTFKKDIAQLKTATQDEALAAFQTISLDLSGQGFSQKTIDDIIQALALQSEKTNVLLKFKNIDISTEEGRVAAKKLTQDSIDALNKELSKGVKKVPDLKLSTVGRGGGSVAGFGKSKIELNTKQQKLFNITVSETAANLTALTSEFARSDMKVKEYESSVLTLINTLPKGEVGLKFLDEALININPNFAKSTKNITDYNTKVKLLRAALIDASVAQDILNGLVSNIPYIAQGAQKRLDELLEIKEKTKKQISGSTTTTTTTTTTKEKNELEKMINSQKQQIQAFNKLIKLKFDYKAATELSNNAALAEMIVNAKTTKSQKQLVAQLKELLKLQKQRAKQESYITDPEEILDLQEKVIDIRYRGSIQQGEAAVKNAEKVVDDIEKEIDGIEKSIEKKRRNIEILYDRPIQALQDEGSILSNNLKLIDTATDEINKKYDTQINALEKISSINQEIANQEKSRLNIATALTSGDVAAAAQAVQDARAQAAASQLEKQKAGIEASRGQAIAGLTAGGMTKDQISQRQLAIEQQIFNLEQQKNAASSAIRLLEDQIYSIQKGKLQVAQDSLIAAQNNLQKINDQKNADLAFINQQKQFFADKKVADDIAKVNMIDYETKVDAARKTADKLLKAILSLNTTVETIHVIRTIKKGMASGADDSESSGAGGSGGSGAGGSGGSDKGGSSKNDKTKPGSNFTYGAGNPFVQPKVAPKSNFTYGAGNPFVQPKTKKMYGGLIKPMNIGGMVPEYFAVGGRMGSDSVPAMLTPGEFVMNRRAAQQFGPLLSMLNESKYPSMIRPSYGTGKGSSRNISIKDNSTDVYNYSVGISVGGTNVSANQIAKTVMNEIKYLDSQRVRGQRVS